MFSQNLEESKAELNQLSKLSLKDYNLEAIRQTKAFGNYIGHISNTELPVEDREEAAMLASSLFINEEVNIEDTVFRKTPLTSNSYITVLSDNGKSNIKIEWNKIISSEDYNKLTAIKRVEIEQVVYEYHKPPKNYLVKNKLESIKIIDCHFVYDKSTKLNRVLLGKILFKI